MRAVTRALDADVDLNDVAGSTGYLFVRDGVGFAARGVAATVDSREVAGILAAIDRDDDVGGPGTGAIALGVKPFRPGEPWSLVIPRVMVGKDGDGRKWITRIDGADDDIDAAPTPSPTVSSFSIEPGVDEATYLAAVAAARDAVRDGSITKAVIARDVVVRSSRPIDVHATLLRLRSSFGSSYRYSIDGLLGASPELLVSRAGDTVRSHPLAGTAPRVGDPAVDERLAAALVASTKNQIEHRIVIEMVHDTLLPWCSYLDWEPEPSIVKVANVQHLGTLVEGRLSHPAPNVLELVEVLCPTPALGGHPRDEALRLIDRVEGIERGPYGGAVGWVDADGNGTWAVAIRCARLSEDRRTARLYAGGGIVADSDPLSELAETQAKMQAMLSAIIRA
ncbi:MAG: isochorismate synthase [Actinomycetota bacterium]